MVYFLGMTSKGIGMTLVIAVVFAGMAGIFFAWWFSPGNTVVPSGTLAATSSVPIRAVSTDIPRLVEGPAAPSSVEPATSSEPIARTTRIIAFGDSVTAGYGLPLDAAYPTLLEHALAAEGFNVSVINMGVSGDTASAGARRVDFALASDPDIVILALGGNDMLRGISPAVTRAELARIIAAFQAKEVVVLLVGMKAQRNLGDAYAEEFDAIYPDLAREYALPFAPFLLEGVALDPALNQSDGIHPTEAGQRIIAEENILPVLRPLLLRMSAPHAE